MLTLADARERALSRIRSQSANLPAGGEFELLDDDTLERDWGWVFFFARRRRTESGHAGYEPWSEGPLIVNRFDGSVHRTGGEHPGEYYVTRYDTEFCRDREGWLLVLRDLDVQSSSALLALREVLDLVPREAAELVRRLPAVVMEGPRPEIVRACQELLAAGVGAEVQRA